MLLAGAPCQRCCWPGCCSGTAGRECHGEEDGGTVAKSHREDAAGRSSLHRRQCCTIGKQLRVDAETPDAGRPVEKRRCRNADSETPMQQRHLGTLLHKSNAQRWVLCVPRCARNQVSELATEHATGKRTSEQATEQATEHATGKRTSELATELASNRAN